MKPAPRRGLRRPARRQGGFTMFETLLTLLIITLWLLGSAGTQSASLRLNKAAQFRNQAILLAADMAERIHANRLGALDGSYVYSGGAASTGADCTANVCQPSDLAAFDLSEWTTRVANTLPGGTAQITTDFGSPMNYTIVVTWTDRRTDKTPTTGGNTETFSYTAVKTIN